MEWNDLREVDLTVIASMKAKKACLLSVLMNHAQAEKRKERKDFEVFSLTLGSEKKVGSFANECCLTTAAAACAR